MNMNDSINLATFVPALDQLAGQIDDSGSDPSGIASAVSALSSGIAATAMLKVAGGYDPACEWDAELEDQTLTIYSATHQMVFSMQMNVLNSAILSGPQGITWKLNRSEKGLHVSSVDSSGSVIQDVVMGSDGSVRTLSEVASDCTEIKEQWEEIAGKSDEELPSYIPDGHIPDLDLPDIDEMADASSPGSDDPSDPDDNDDGPDGFSSAIGSGASAGQVDNGSMFSSVPSAGIANMVGSALKGAAAVGIAAGAGAVARSIGKAVSVKKGPEKLVLKVQGEEQVEIASFPLTIGRGKDCGLILDSNLVSRKHAQLSRKENDIILEDPGSSNGSFINDTRLEGSQLIYKGDMLRFANIEVEVIAGPEREPEAVPEENMKTVTFNMAEKLEEAKQKRGTSEITGQKPAVKTPPPTSRKAAPPPPPPAPSPKKPAPPAPEALKKPEPKPVEKINAAKSFVCIGCKFEIAADAKFCKNCGRPTKIDLKCKFCGERLAEDAKFCPGCGKPTFGEQSEPPKKASAPPPTAASKQTKADSPLPPPPAPQRKKHHEEPVQQRSRIKHYEDESEEFVKRVSDDETSEKPALPSVRWVSWIFAVFFIADYGNTLQMIGESALDKVSFIRGLGAGLAILFFAFFAGSSSGFFRLATMISSGVFVGNQLMHHGEFYLDIIKDPDLLSKDPTLWIPIITLLLALWILKRAARRS